jgi:hypothetical protein
MMFYFHIPEGICFAGFLPFLARGYTLHISILCCRQTQMQRTAKLKKENRTEDTTVNVQSKTTCKKRQKTREADSFRNTKVLLEAGEALYMTKTELPQWRKITLHKGERPRC